MNSGLSQHWESIWHCVPQKCNVFILWGRLLLWEIRHLLCCWGSKRAEWVHDLLKIMQNADWCLYRDWESQAFCAGSELLSGLHNLAFPLLSLSLSSFRFPPVLQQFWEVRWCVPSPALKELSELLGHEAESVQSILPCAPCLKKSRGHSGNLSSEKPNLQIPTGMYMA